MLVGLLANTVFAQGRVSQYTTTNFTGTWNDISETGNSFYLNDWRVWTGSETATLTMPFDFNYDGTDVPAGTDVTIGAGTICFGDYYTYYDILGNQSYPGMLCFLSEYINTGDGNNGDNANYWEVSGSEPNRVFTIELRRLHYPDNCIFCGNIESNVQVKLYEGTNVIEFQYMDHNFQYYNYYDPWGGGFGIGLNGFTSPSFVYNTYSSGSETSPSTDVRFTPPAPPAQLSLQPKNLNFGSFEPGGDSILCVTVSSVGSSPLHITSTSLTGDRSYTVVSGPGNGTAIQPGNSVQYCIEFQPLSPGVLTGTFTVVTDGKDSGTQSVSLTGVGAFPTVSYGTNNLFRRTDVELSQTSQTEYIPVSSTGLGPLTFNSIYFIGLNANNYQVVHWPQNPLPPDATDSIGVQFSPTIEGRPEAYIVINTNAYNNPHDTIQMFGVGTLPHLAITVPAPGSGNTVMFDSVAIGDSVCQTIQLTNNGTDTLHILKQIVTYGDYDFSFYPLAGGDTVILPGGGTKLVNICFKPLKAGSRYANIRFYTDIPHTFETPQRDTSQFLINVTGTGVPYGHLVAIGSLTDTATVGDSLCVTVMLKNNGQADLTVNGNSLSPDKSHFHITVPNSFTLAPGQTQPMTFCFAPDARGTLFDTLNFTGTTAEQAFSQAFLLTGVGVVSCVTVDSAISFGTSGMTMVGATDTSCITVSNCGDIATTYTAALSTMGTPYMLEAPLTSSVIPAGGTATFCVVFTPTTIGASNANVQITGGPSAKTVVLTGVGAGVVASATGSVAKPVLIGTCDTFAVQVTNNGNVSWTPGTGTITGTNASDFSIVSGPTPGTIAPGASATVMIAFCATQNGTESMTLTFPSASPAPITAFSYSTTAVGTSEGISPRTSEAGFSIGASYPNPTSGSADMMVTLPYQAPVQIDLIDATGALVKTAFHGNLAGGSQVVTLDVKGLPSGTYFVQLSSGDVRLARQMSVIK